MHYTQNPSNIHTQPLIQPYQGGHHSILQIFLNKQKSLLLVTIASLYVVFLIIHSLQRLLLPQRDGILALGAIFSPYLFVPLLIFLPFCFLRYRGLLRIVLVIGALLFGLNFPPAIAFPQSAPADASHFTAMTWNAYMDNDDSQALYRALKEKHPDIVTLQEVNNEEIFNAEDLIKSYPYHFYHEGPDFPTAEVFLSKYPVLQTGVLEDEDGHTWDIPRVFWAKLDLGHDKTLLVINAHTLSAVNTTYNCLFCPELRDKQIHAISQFVTSVLQKGENVLLMGDLNVTDREVAYKELSQQLRDTHLLAGNGPGHTWGRIELNPLWAIIRIDYMFISTSITPLSQTTDCSKHGSDHCIVTGEFSLS
ncbi:endonuclease/exonuclease/phosphatase (EEP) superfamily protein YafD [Thermosporothrix hazakensis]|jgi:endonuclease/exonuclease/phosphatase (EEP) superfamily protein YafD|uniref:Endonuclease/exonuclease/phosphatase (EEP) superfamily protein YafD n=2 Tax=Thermosporothrix TaxID=768650 RepID=A0A326U586_THEHA|nr:endonuclease/exonuclease/phosphatase family protein [Thermosporothrix hazakensis]PZW28433.1 endonuclease/exonuclease/phosphatase (EEP) superfamily protein YafD [Thermosporothrix hazakensis]BBH86378.1 hypothetical protein KTC_11290 [Thermosporothrix sp. COM3]GCE45211.1 hypothetical protein KTH_00800 [Thermosporothrix hazakensis]